MRRYLIVVVVVVAGAVDCVDLYENFYGVWALVVVGLSVVLLFKLKSMLLTKNLSINLLVISCQAILF